MPSVCRRLSLAGLIGVVLAGPQAVAQADLKAIADMKGECRAEIDGQPVPCQPFAIYMELANGRSMVVFGLEGKTYYSFSGPSPVAHEVPLFAMTVDTVRIATEASPDRTLGDIEGRCAVRTDPAPYRFSAVDCDGKDGARYYRFTLDHITDFQRKVSR